MRIGAAAAPALAALDPLAVAAAAAAGPALGLLLLRRSLDLDPLLALDRRLLAGFLPLLALLGTRLVALALLAIIFRAALGALGGPLGPSVGPVPVLGLRRDRHRRRGRHQNSD